MSDTGDLRERLIRLRDAPDRGLDGREDYFLGHHTRELLAEAADRIAELEAELQNERASHTETLDEYDAMEAERDRYLEALKAAQSREAELRRALVEAIEIAEGCHECVTADCSIEPTLARLKKLADV